MWNCIDWDSDSDLDIIAGIDTWSDYGWDNAFDSLGRWKNGPLHGYVYLLENQNGTYVNAGRIQAGGEDIDVYGAPCPCIADFDADGDLDIICGEFLDGLTWFENVSSDGTPVFKAGRRLRNADGEIRFHLQMIVPAVSDFNDDGLPDIIAGDEDGRVAWLRNTGKVEDGMPVFSSPEYFRQEADLVKFGALSTPYAADWDGDGLADIIMNSITGKIQWLRNTGSADMLELEAPKPVEIAGTAPKPAWNWWNPAEGELVTQWRTTPAAIDWNEDGLTDIIMLDHEGYLAFYERFRDSDASLRLRQGKRIFIGVNCSVYDPQKGVADSTCGPLRLNSKKAGQSGRRKICFADWDGDGLADLLVDSRNTAWFKNLGTDENGKVLLEYRGDISDVKLAGHSTCPAVFDWGNDGIPDIICGAEDGHFYLLRNNIQQP